MLNTEINNYNGYNISSIGNVKGAVSAPQNKTANFKGNVSAPLEKDTVEISTKNKKKLSKKQKWAIGVGSVLGLAAAGIAITHHKHSTISKLYKEKLILSNLPEKIEFKEAKTAEEGIKFAKEILGIKEVDEAFKESVDAINVANKGLVDIANAYKGKLFLPPKLHFQEMKDTTIAGVVRDIKSPYFGNLIINKKFFNEKFLNNELDEIFQIRKYAPKTDKKALTTAEKTIEKETKEQIKRQDLIHIQWSDEFHELHDKYTKSADSLTMMEKRKMYGIYQNTADAYSNIWDRNPYTIISNNKKLFTDQGLEINLEKLSKLSLKEQSEELEKLCKEYYKKTKKPLIYNQSNFDQSETIWHEVGGHLQDYAKNLKELDLKKHQIGTKEYWKNFFKKDLKEVNKELERDSVDELNNRWGSIGHEEFKKFFEENPEAFKKKYPELYEFLTNREIQSTAGKISAYAQTGIGEFIAETAKEMIRVKKEGRKLSDEVIALYRKYNGPELPA